MQSSLFRPRSEVCNPGIGLKDGEIVYRGTAEDIRKMTDDEFKEIYGEEAIRTGAASITGGGEV